MEAKRIRESLSTPRRDRLRRTRQTNKGQKTKTRLCYNIDNLDIGNRRRCTFEFRQNCGKISPDKILAWIKGVAGLVEFADTVQDDLLEDFLRSYVDDELEDYPAIDLLRVIGRPNETEFYEKIMLKNDQVINDRDSEAKPSSTRRSQLL